MGKGKRRLDIILLFATLALVGIGIVMVYSTSAIIAGDRFGDPYYFLKRQNNVKPSLSFSHDPISNFRS